MVAAVVAFEEARKRDRLARDSGRLLDLYHRRLQRLQHEWMGKGDPGVDLQMADHLSARDLDLFGEGSLFELLCDVQTPAGRDALAQWLQSPAPPEEVISRQHAIRSLRDRTDLRERLALLRGDEASEYSWNRLRDWLTASPVRFPRWAPWAGLLLSLSMASVALCGWNEVIEPHDALRVLADHRHGARGACSFPPPPSPVHLGWHAFARKQIRIDAQDVHARGWRTHGRGRCSARCNSGSEDRPNLFPSSSGWCECVSCETTNTFSGRSFRSSGSTQWTMRIERWRQLHGRDLLQYLTVLGEFEALMAIAAYAYENPADPYPELVGEGPLFEATGMGHPLMDVRTCVQNDLTLGGETHFLLVTGSNMSGKSTLLRAVGLNATLAWMGAPVRAARLRLSPLQVCASIRVDDSLMNGRSHFYAEVERLKAMFDCAASGPPVLFLIDELFGGTNSADRRVAAEAVIRLLVERRGYRTGHIA